jgi:hypothetical protein
MRFEEIAPLAYLCREARGVFMPVGGARGQFSQSRHGGQHHP